MSQCTLDVLFQGFPYIVDPQCSPKLPSSYSVILFGVELTHGTCQSCRDSVVSKRVINDQSSTDQLHGSLILQTFDQSPSYSLYRIIGKENMLFFIKFNCRESQTQIWVVFPYFFIIFVEGSSKVLNKFPLSGKQTIKLPPQKNHPSHYHIKHNKKKTDNHPQTIMQTQQNIFHINNNKKKKLIDLTLISFGNKLNNSFCYRFFD